MIGTMFRLKIPVLNCDAGHVGYVFEVYDDYDVRGEWGVQVIFPNGDYCGFSVKEQAIFFENAGFCSRVSGYKFQNVMQVSRDHRNGYWFPKAKRSRY